MQLLICYTLTECIGSYVKEVYLDVPEKLLVPGLIHQRSHWQTRGKAGEQANDCN